eukprot:TRINITY_DN8747_c0_g1_i2.p1 TRINITY_DN8747_c0_g1~~TRINITY_DN8747_c0_g1_i2.p1  ORF type:complete len:325 (-),score=89.40 TRINITY_DN8747_c0_g1_i2:47-1021(-)
MGNQFKENKGRGIDSRDVRKESTKGRQTKSSIDKDKTQGEKGNDSEDFEHSQSGDEGSGGDEEPKQKRKRSETISANTFLRDLKHRIGSKEQSEPKNKVRNEEREEDFVERLSDQILKRVMDKFEAKMIERFGDLFLSKQVFQQFLPNLITKKDYEIMEKKIRDIKVEIENLGQKEEKAEGILRREYGSKWNVNDKEKDRKALFKLADEHGIDQKLFKRLYSKSLIRKRDRIRAIYRKDINQMDVPWDQEHIESYWKLKAGRILKHEVSWARADFDAKIKARLESLSDEEEETGEGSEDNEEEEENEERTSAEELFEAIQNHNK